MERPYEIKLGKAKLGKARMRNQLWGFVGLFAIAL